MSNDNQIDISEIMNEVPDFKFLDANIASAGYVAVTESLEGCPYKLETDEVKYISWRYGWLLAFYDEITQVMLEEADSDFEEFEG